MLKRSIAFLVVLAILYIGGCAVKSTLNQRQFNAIVIGDSESRVVALLGAADVEETNAKPFLRYASTGCEGSCSSRLWYENRLTFDIEAWSFDIDKNGRVVHKYHWVSP